MRRRTPSTALQAVMTPGNDGSEVLGEKQPRGVVMSMERMDRTTRRTLATIPRDARIPHVSEGSGAGLVDEG